MSKPKIRFKGCQGEWSSSTFVDTFQFLKNNSLSRACLGSNGDVKNVHYGDVLIRFGENLDVGKEALPYISNGSYGRALAKRCSLQDGDVIIADAAEDNTVGKATELMSVGDNTVVSGLHTIPCRPTLTFGPCYLGYYLNSKAYHNQLLPLIQGTKICSISKHALENTTVSYPPTLPEQRQIAAYFRSLDGILSGCESRLLSLRRLKEGALQAFFPQQGETQPKIRFKGCKGEWERKKLGECLEISDERNLDGRYKRDDVLSVSDDFGVVNQIELLGRSYAGKTLTNYDVLRTGQIVYTKSPLRSKPYGIVKLNTGKPGIVSSLYAVYNAKPNISADYLHWYFDPAWRLNAYIRPLVNKGAKNTMNISDETALTGYIYIPPTLTEQHLIAHFFRTLDRRIELERQRLEKLKQLKAACLEKMFV